MASAIGVEPRRRVVATAAEVELVAAAPAYTWSGGGALLHGIPIERGNPRSEWGPDPIVAPR